MASDRTTPSGNDVVPSGQLRSSSRYQTLILFVSMAILLYLSRFSLTPATDQMIRDLNVTRGEFGSAVGSFFLAYALLQVPAGILLDFWSVRWPLGLFVLGWSIATGMLGLVDGLAAIIACRIALGICQAGAYPAAASALSHWFPATERARANSATSTGGRAGGLIALGLTPILMGVLGGWRWTFIAYGICGAIWSIWFMFWFRDYPEQHASCNAAERNWIASGRIVNSPETSQKAQFSLASAILNRNVWLLSIINFFLNTAWIFLVAWMPTYLLDKFPTQIESVFGGNLNSPTAIAGILTAITAFAGMLGNLSGGVLTDRLLIMVGATWARRLPGILSSVLAAALYFFAIFAEDLILLVALMACVSFLADLSIGALWATYQDVGGKLTASMLGWVNMCGNLGAAFSAWGIAQLAEGEQWYLVFGISAGCFCVCAICWTWVDPTRTLHRNKQENTARPSRDEGKSFDSN